MATPARRKKPEVHWADSWQLAGVTAGVASMKPKPASAICMPWSQRWDATGETEAMVQAQGNFVREVEATLQVEVSERLLAAEQIGF